MALFSTRVRYALRFMVEVHRSSASGSPIAAGAVAAKTGISVGYLEQLIRPLAARGLLRGHKGKLGGYRLARDASAITVGEIVEAVIGTIGVSECTIDASHCIRSEYCECRLLFRLLSEQLRTTLDAVTLADMSDVRKLDRVRHDLVGLRDARVTSGSPAAPAPAPLPIKERHARRAQG